MPSPGSFAEFVYNGGKLDVTDAMIKAWQEDGGVLVRKLFDAEELANIEKGIRESEDIQTKGYDMADGDGHTSRLSIWSHPGEDVTGMMARCEKVAETCEKLLGGEVYHYHSKLIMKEPRTGGKFLWHQDYGYWYKNGNLRPDMMTVFIAIDPCVKANGCLQAVKGSHLCGRIEHDLTHGQTSANQERVDKICEQCEKVYVELQPGDALFFHCNILHTSDKNQSDMRRYAFLIAYNKADNNPVYEHHHPKYTPLVKTSNTSVKTCRNYTNMDGKEFMDPNFFRSYEAEFHRTGFH